jgi:hypothetical protein
MMNPSWLDLVRQRLAKHVLPPNYVERVVEELADHLEDLKEENVEADAYSRLGDPEQVAEAAVITYRRRSFLGRHPVAAFVVFGISPVIPQFVLFVVGEMVLMTFKADHTVNWHEDHWILSPIIVVCSTFVSFLYGELAMRLGIGKKWMLASCAVLGAFAMLQETGLGVTVMLLAQFAAPLAVGCWLTTRKCIRGYPATTFLVFAISPLASYMLLSFMAVFLLAATVVFAGLSVFVLLMCVIPAVAASSLLHRKLAKGLRSGRKWMFISCLLLATFAAMPFMPILFIFVIPVAVASFLHCKLARRSGIGWKWMFVSCMVLAIFAATESFPLRRLFEYDSDGQHHFCVGLWACFSLAQFLTPLAIGWWFMRRNRDQGQLQLAS